MRDFLKKRGIVIKSRIPPKIYKDGWEEIGVYPNVAVFLKRTSDFKYPHGGFNQLLITFADGDETYTNDENEVKQVMLMLAADRVGATSGFARIGSMPTKNKALQEELQRSVRVESILWDYKYYPDIAPWDDGSYGSQFQEPTFIEEGTRKYGPWRGFPEWGSIEQSEGAKRLRGEQEDDDWDDEVYKRTPEWGVWYQLTKQNEVHEFVNEAKEKEKESGTRAEDAARKRFEEIKARKYDFSSTSRGYFKKKNKAPVNKRRKRMVRETRFRMPIPVRGTDVNIIGLGMDINGNSVVRLKPKYGNARGFSIQTNGNLPALHRIRRNVITNNVNKRPMMVSNEVNSMISKQIKDYIDNYGTKRQTKMALNRASGGRMKYPKSRENVGYYGGATMRRRR
jgi:hypothetical protein